MIILGCSAPNLKSESDSDYSASNSEDDEEGKEEEDTGGEKNGMAEVQPKTPSKAVPAVAVAAAALYKTPAKKSKKAPEVSDVSMYRWNVSRYRDA